MLTISPAHAQKNEPPSGQFGMGIYASNFYPSGIEGIYAVSENLQVGSELGLRVGTGNTIFLFAPFVRFQFSSKVSPFIQGGFNIADYGGAANAGLFFGGGLAYYLNRTVGVHADVDIINVTFTAPSSIFFGWSIVRAGADWFF